MFKAEGHHFSLYLNAILESLNNKQQPYKVVLTPELKSSPAFDVIASKLRDNNVILIRNQLKGLNNLTKIYINLLNWYRLRRDLKDHLTADSVSKIYIPTLDPMAKAFELLGSPFSNIPFYALYMSPLRGSKINKKLQHKIKNAISELLFFRLVKLNSMKKLLLIDPLFFLDLIKSKPDLKNKIDYINDFSNPFEIISSSKAREKLNILTKNHIILVYGSLNKRKGIIELLNALNKSNIKNICILLAGKPEKSIEKYIKSHPIVSKLKNSGQLFLKLKFLSSYEEKLVFSSANSVWLGYTMGFDGSSGVLHQSVKAKLPVLSMRDGVIGFLTKKFKLGYTFNPVDINEVISVLKKLEIDGNNSFINSETFEEFMNDHSSIKHTKKILRLIC